MNDNNNNDSYISSVGGDSFDSNQNVGALPHSPRSDSKEKPLKIGTAVEPTPSLTLVPTIEHEIQGPQIP